VSSIFEEKIINLINYYIVIPVYIKHIISYNLLTHTHTRIHAYICTNFRYIFIHGLKLCGFKLNKKNKRKMNGKRIFIFIFDDVELMDKVIYQCTSHFMCSRQLLFV
jgi:hypothetical protein